VATFKNEIMALLKKIQKGALLSYLIDKDGKKIPDIYDGGDEWIRDRGDGTLLRFNKELNPTWFIAYLWKWAGGNIQLTKEGAEEMDKYADMDAKAEKDNPGNKYDHLAERQLKYREDLRKEIEEYEYEHGHLPAEYGKYL
jgi:hypothetical protein